MTSTSRFRTAVPGVVLFAVLLGSIAWRAAGAQQVGRSTGKAFSTAGTWRIGPSVPLPMHDQTKHIWVSAAPDDPDRLIACLEEDDSAHASRHVVAYVSLDGGNTWMTTLDDRESDWVSEASCAAGSNGSAYVGAGVSNPQRGDPLPHGTTEIFRSFDEGLHWSPPQRLPFVDWTNLASTREKVYLFGHLLAEGIGDHGIGNWRNKTRPLFVSRDKGETFSLPLFPSDQANNAYRLGYPMGSIVTDDGNVLALYMQSLAQQPTDHPKAGYAIYQVTEKAFEKISEVSVPQEMEYVEAFAVQLAADLSARHRGRLYLAFSGMAAGRAAMALAISDDLGKKWNTRIVFRGGEVPPPALRADLSPLAGIAVNRDGVVGVEWMPSNGCPLFAVSADGGDSFSKLGTLGNCSEREPASLRGLAAAKSLFALSFVNTKRGTSEAGAPGFSFRVDPSMVWSTQLVADAAGRFHVFWPERQFDGSAAILTSVVSTTPASERTVSLDRMENLSARTVIQVLENRFDPLSATLGADVVAKNAGTEAIPYPAFLEAYRDSSDCGRVAYLNSQTVSSTGRPVYLVPSPPHTDFLRPGEASLPVHLQIHIDGCQSIQPSLFDRSRVRDPKSEWFFDLIWVHLRAYGNSSSVRK
jgi:hypothetical protein